MNILDTHTHTYIHICDTHFLNVNSQCNWILPFFLAEEMLTLRDELEPEGGCVGSIDLRRGWSLGINLDGYPLVNVYISIENHHFQWENPLFQWPFSIAMLNYQRVTVQSRDFP